LSDVAKKVAARFYRSASGSEPVRKWLKGMDRTDRKAIGTAIAVAEYGWPIGMPTCRTLGKGLHEIRTDLENGRISRVFFCVHEGSLVLLHGMIKKTQTTPGSDLAIARRRQQEVQR
jgi:phage-related protein